VNEAVNAAEAGSVCPELVLAESEDVGVGEEDSEDPDAGALVDAAGVESDEEPVVGSDESSLLQDARASSAAPSVPARAARRDTAA
jgi:hypothetical protein